MTDMNPEKPTEEWVTGDEPLTGPQASYLGTLAREAGEEVPDGLTKAQASEMIDRLQDVTGRGANPPTPADEPQLFDAGADAGPDAPDAGGANGTDTESRAS
jgi:hypothetical protein